jgi:FkbM family methyltransferase
VLGGRPATRVLKEIFEPRNYLGLARMARVAVHPFDLAGRYFVGRGTYPYDCALRTPLGVVAPTVYSHHDVWTVVEIFCREDYRADTLIEVVVDVGSNIGISALYFLTRNHASRCYLYEPDPRNVERLEHNLSALRTRWRLEPAAVGPTEGIVDFAREETGRYGSIDSSGPDLIRVPCRAVNDVLTEVLELEGAIDVLKIDTEGLEPATVASIRPELLARIDTVYFESTTAVRLHQDEFDFGFANETVRLRRRGD